jgi:hypothetical protein
MHAAGTSRDHSLTGRVHWCRERPALPPPASSRPYSLPPQNNFHRIEIAMALSKTVGFSLGGTVKVLGYQGVPNAETLPNSPGY